ncbi:MAG: hypothetical protein M1470_10490 [Bacteroidetes bacterium]|nr:hypothetical protein [Bacteroidota bacterium]
MKKYGELLFLTLFTLVGTVSSNCFAADSLDNKSQDVRVWTTFGFGFARWASDPAITLGASLNAKLANELLTARFLYNDVFQISIFGPPSHPDENVWDIGILYGRIAKGRYGYASISGGLSLIRGVRYQSGYAYTPPYGYTYADIEDSFTGVGIPAEAQLFWTPTNFFGIGLYAFCDYGFSGKRSFGGVMLSLQFGQLK